MDLSPVANIIYNMYLEEYYKTNNKHVTISRKMISSELDIPEKEVNCYINELVNKFLLTPSYCGQDNNFIHCTLNI